MAPVFSLMTCVMLFLAVEHSVQAADSITVNESMLEDTLAKRGSSSGGNLSTVVTQLIASVESIKKDLPKIELKIQKTELKLQETEQNLQKAVGNLPDMQRDLKRLIPWYHGSIFVRWGRETCPANTALVYTGFAAGKAHYQKGSGTNRLCLSESSQFGHRASPPQHGDLYGGEYQEIENNFYYEVPCVVCRAHHPTTIMIAGTLTCPPGWTGQYTGHLTAERYDHYANEYVCLDRDPENYSRQRKKDAQGTFYYVITQCGSLPCPPYQNKKLVTCVVCSK